ncbi:MlaD family protein [Pararhodonellum marinum]|uniref:MlaD family protein n=1 Tax=Pararhodonellum marinum TaxID=2755358 RepID=UPI00188E2660|nr:MlaD family protein [Pararhodonellum marinum]
MKKENKSAVMVGIFVLIGIGILVAGILTLGGQQKKFVKSIRLNAVFDDVAGLQTGNNVWFSGVKIGTVRKIHFYGESQVEIEMNVETASRDYIRKDSKATISSDGLIGNKIIVIYGGTSQSRPVENGDRLEAVMPLDTDQMMETLQVNNENLVSITSDLKVLTGKIAGGEGIVGAVMTDSTLADNFRAILVNLERASVNSNRLLNEINSMTTNLNKEGTLFHDLSNDTVVFQSMKASIADLQSTADNAKTMTENLTVLTERMNDEDNTIGLLLNDKEFAETLKSTMINADSSAANLNRGLEALEYTWPFRRGFKRKAKQEAKEAENN